MAEGPEGIVHTCPSCRKKNLIRYSRLSEQARCGACGTALPPPSEPVAADQGSELAGILSESSLPVLVDFWAPWCGPCRSVAPEIAKVAQRHAGRLLVVKVNTDELSDLGQRFGIRSIPTLAVFAGGKEVARESGARPAEEIEAFIAQARVTAR